MFSSTTMAALNGTNQVVFAILATTLALVAIFLPVGFMGGIIGRFFESFAVVVTVGVLISYFVAVTLTPMLCSRYLRVQHDHGRLYTLFENGFLTMDRVYKRLLDAALRHRWVTVGLAVLLVLSSGWFFVHVGKAFTPQEDEGQFLIIVRTPLGSSIEYTDTRLRMVEQVLASEKSVRNYFTAIGLGGQGQVNQGFAFVRMYPRDERKERQQDLLPRLNKVLATIPGARAFATPVPMISGQRGDPLQFVVRGPQIDRVAQYAGRIRDRLLAEHPELGRVDLDLQLDLPQLVLDVDRARARSLGLDTFDVALAANVLAGGVDVAKYNDSPGDGERYDIRLKAAAGVLADVGDMRRIYLRNADGEMIRLDTVAHFEETIGPAVIGRYNLQYAANFYSTPNIALSAAVNIVREVAREELPLGYGVLMLGEAKEFEQTAGYVGFAFILATALVYMVLASQFNSFIQPIIIMVAQPLAIIGGLIALWLTGHTLNIFSMIGMILLIGLVAKNSILLVDLTNQYRARGMAIDEALREACPIRMRPVMMTSLTLILALMPAASGLGAGTDTVGPLAVAVIGGMISSTLLALVVVPVVYSLIETALERRARSKLSGVVSQIR
ncbi:MAG: efflux RND transporter permease subunit [Chromatiales bacterium]|jgi:HAE1 family hydrophobic/amphiphilic exporter-1|nr:efflux RND transporter permease subunit [Chromatiales bacterium]